ncbi:GIY-YIG nuclease family protein [Candidatus Mycoplasma mahonii]|uniref:GIY-YIG nuclease family protein n=1 Tax=Candidatus Mycoplasma mahonii TaxID=3004105 RepID=UPI0026EF2367|nr:GIY-YIG nuclease family protein [Candidatus Mycoplasma mahonii]WKX02438.1 GIY-YIG nuclease family protein [Candidatus Mycoplasma mahonii]
MKIDDLKQVPKNPGVYIWKDKFDNVLYVGKAKRLDIRMKQYFKGMLNSYKTAKLVDNIASFKYFITKNEKEALILERNLISKYSPEYNIKLSDDKRYPYIVASLASKLSIKLAYRLPKSKSKNTIIYGPFPTGFRARRMVNLLTRLTTYENGIPKESNDPIYWKKQFEYTKKLLSSGSKSLLKTLEGKMTEAANKEQYEVAHDIQESIKALDFYKDTQNVQLTSLVDTDVIGFLEKDGYLSISMLFYRQGLLLSKKERIIEITSSLNESTRQFASQYYAYNYMPKQIISNFDFESEINVLIPMKGSKKEILDLALINASNNIDIKLKEFIRHEELTMGAVDKLKKLLNLINLHHIIMIDNSNTNNTNPVSAIVSYRNGIKQKNEYKKYNLEIGTRLADVDYMKQGITRYFSNEKNAIPDLLIVDGGKAQVNEIKKIFTNVPIIGLVKNSQHLTDHMINLEGQDISIEDQNLFNFLKGIQIEVDRFAKYHHNFRRRKSMEGILKTIPGIGDVTERKLLEHFKTYSAIYNSSFEDLCKVVSKKIAKLLINNKN